MEEDEYKSTYKEITNIPCVFEKVLTNHRAKCGLSRHFCLADREGYACEDEGSSHRCNQLLQTLREKSAFALKLHEVKGPLPHNMEIRVQAGGIEGIAIQLAADRLIVDGVVQDIEAVLSQAQQHYGSLESLPYSNIIQSVVHFKGRRRRQK